MADVIEDNQPQSREVPATNQGLSDFLKEKVEGYKTEPSNDDAAIVNERLLGTNETQTDEEKKRLSDSTDESNKKDKDEEVKDEDKEVDPDADPDAEEVDADEDADAADKDKDKDEKEEGEDGKGDDKAKDEVEPEPGKPVPYERFKQAIDERTKAQAEFAREKPKIENFQKIQRFCSDNSITPDQFEQAMRVQALLNTDPQKALEAILPIVEQLQGFTGGKLPKDLQEEVDAEKLSPARAKEIATLRAQTQFKDAAGKRNLELQQRRAQEEMNQQMANTAGEWEEKKRLGDPDYRPKKNEAAADGLYEDVQDKFQALVTKTNPTTGEFLNPVRTAADLQALLDRAYKSVKDKWNGGLATRKAATGKKLPSNGANSSKGKVTEENAPTMAAAIQARLASRR